jgi:hypothetical protein
MPLRICFLSAEFAPFSKAGGLGDVASALTGYLAGIGHELRVFVPRHAQTQDVGVDWHAVDPLQGLDVQVGARSYRYDVRTAAFDASLGPFGRDARASVEAYRGGGETAIGDALRSTLRRVDPDSVAAVLVLSDGIANRGEDPERARGAALPAFALTVGSRSDPPTVGIAGVETPSEMIVGRPTPIVVTVRQGARPASSGVVRVSEEGRELGRASFSLTGASASARVTIPVAVQSRGKRFLEIELSGIENDPVRENKRRLVAVEARPWKRSVVILSTSWDWDLRSLARGVEEDTTIAVVRATPAGGSQVTRLHGGPASLETLLDGAEAAVLRYDAAIVTPERADILMRYLQRGGGLFLWIDPKPRVPQDSPLTRALALQWRFLGQPIGHAGVSLNSLATYLTI